MIKVYETTGCLGGRRVKKWLDEKGLDYTVVNFEKCPVKKSEIRWLLQTAEDVYDVVSPRSIPVKDFKKNHGMDLEDLSFNQLIEFLQENPHAFRRPMMTNGKVLIAGFDEEEMSALLPKSMRQFHPESKVES